jgi:hypothetical protein
VCLLWCFRRSQPLVKTALDVQPGYAQLQEPFLLGKPYALRSGEELGDSERERDGGDLSAPRMEGTPKLDEAEGDLAGRTAPMDCGIAGLG